MELQFKESGIRILEDAVRNTRNMELTQEIRLSGSMPDIGRVLTAWGQVCLRTKEWNRDEIVVSGGVTVWVLYLPEDGTEPRTVENWIPFQMKWDVEPGQEGTIRIAPMLRFVDGRGISARKMMVRAGLGAEVQAVRRVERGIFCPADVPENVELLKRTYPVRIPKEAGERIFLLDEELSLQDSLPQPEKILSYSIHPVLTEQKVLSDKLVFKGTETVHVVYRCSEGSVRNADLEIPFAQYAELDGQYSQDARAEVWIVPTSMELDVSEGGRLRLKAGFVGQYLVDEKHILELTEDAYSPFREVEPVFEPLQMPSVLDERVETLQTGQTIPGQTGQIADIRFYPDFPRRIIQDGNTKLEVPVVVQVLFYGQDGSLQSSNVRWECEISVPSDEKTQLFCSLISVGAPTVMVGTDEIRISSQLRLHLRSMAETEIPMVTKLELGEHREADPDRPSLILRRPGRDDLWTIAKRCGSTVEAICRANNLQGEPDPDRMIMIPVS